MGWTLINGWDYGMMQGRHRIGIVYALSPGAWYQLTRQAADNDDYFDTYFGED